MGDRLDYITAMKNVLRTMPEEAEVIREYVGRIRSGTRPIHDESTENEALPPSQLERELVTLLFDYVGETGTSESAVEVLSRLLTELVELRRAARDFVDKVERGEARSVRSYRAFKLALGEPLH